MKIKYLIIVIAFIAILLGVLFINKNTIERKKEIAVEKNTAIPVHVTKPIYTANLEKLLFSGEIIAGHELAVMSKSEGSIIHKYKKLGDYVEKGMVIAQIENEVIKKKLKIARENLLKAEKDLNRYRSLFSSDVVNINEVESLEINKRSIDNLIIDLEEALRNTTIIAPINGYITKDFFEIGSLVTIGTCLFELVNVEELKVKAIVTENDIMKISKGDSVTVTNSMYPDRSFLGEISSVSLKSNGVIGYMVEIKLLSNYSNFLKPGMFVNIEKKTGTSECNILAIEKQCLVEGNENPCVYVVKNGRACLKNVTIGIRNNNYVQIKSGINISDTIVSNGWINLSDNDLVIIK